MSSETIILGGGCFWCIEAIIKDLRGVEEVLSGYAGGSIANPTYEQICRGDTGHAEVVQVKYNTSTITTKDLLRVFFTLHNPTTKNRQGADVGEQYRSIVITTTEEQTKDTREVIEELESEGIWGAPFVTELITGAVFYPAEAYHQDFYDKNQFHPYCQVVIEPKIAKLRKAYLGLLKTS
jgi:peptide-methionine (S)-S-oxide reductase